MLALALMAATGGAALRVTEQASIQLPARSVRAGDVVAGLPRSAAAVEITRVAAGRPRLTLSRRAVATLVRRAMPGIVIADGDARTIVFRAVAKRPAPVVSHAARQPEPAIALGDALTLRVRAGSVAIERPVVALQPGYAGRRMFVRDAGGRVFAASVEGAGK